MTKPTRASTGSKNKLTNYFRPIPLTPVNTTTHDVIIVSGPAVVANTSTNKPITSDTKAMPTATALPPVPKTPSTDDSAEAESTTPFRTPTCPASLQLQRENSAALELGPGSASGSQASGKGPARVIPSSDGEESDADSDDLEDLSALLRPTKQKTHVKKPAEPLPSSVKSNAFHMPKPLNFSLERLVQQKTRASELSSKIERTKRLEEEVNSKPAEKINGVASQKSLEGVFGEIGSGRLMAALTRKDAWRVEKSWHLFDTFNERPHPKKNTFPLQCLPQGGVLATLANVAQRQQMFLSGFVQDMVRVGLELPEEFLLWMLDEVCLEPRQDLSYAYARTLASLPLQKIKALIASERIIHMFQLLGGRPEALELQKQINLTPSSQLDEKPRSFWNVKLVVCFLGSLANRYLYNSEIIRPDNTAIQTECGILVRLALDVRACLEGDLLNAIDDSLEQILLAIPEDEWIETSLSISHDLMRTLTIPQYRFRALSILPVHTPRLHLFRRRLALACLFEESSYLLEDYPSLVRLRSISRILRRPQFQINHNTDYSELQALICILDIAIDDGVTSGDDVENDKLVDVIVETLQAMFSSINDTNAQNLSRTEAKDTIERLQFRLRFAVRSKPNKVSILSDEVGPDFAGRDGMVQTRLSWGKKKGANGAVVNGE
ncbi:hypothetical protein RUND412_009676 [Rhizina undulata]